MPRRRAVGGGDLRAVLVDEPGARVHVVPFEEYDAENVFPVRTSFTHCGGSMVGTTPGSGFAADPAVVERASKRSPSAGVRATKTYFESAFSVSRIITPALVHACT